MDNLADELAAGPGPLDTGSEGIVLDRIENSLSGVRFAAERPSPGPRGGVAAQAGRFFRPDLGEGALVDGRHVGIVGSIRTRNRFRGTASPSCDHTRRARSPTSKT